MAAVPASPLEAGASARGSQDYFSFFGIKRRFGIDRAALERRFYELSRQFHPDRFATAGAVSLAEALLRMSELNEAYTTLKEPALLREHYLELEGLSTLGEKGSPPVELAESWFELQDALIEQPETAAAQVRAFRQQLQALQARGAEALAGIEARIDQAREAGPDVAPRELLEKIASEIRAQSYLKSMLRDVERIGHAKH